MMVFFRTLILALSVAAVRITYNPVYDNGTFPVNATSCAGAKGVSKFTTFDSIPSFARIAAANVVSGINKEYCGSCWAVLSEGNIIYVTVVDRASAGWTISEAALNDLTNGEAAEVGVIEGTVQEVRAKYCGL
ncbi:Cerato-platanin [Hysterangium stoloniferum]|nr:Cerato-platanin [Hysterangium stoloniferum]